MNDSRRPIMARALLVVGAFGLLVMTLEFLPRIDKTFFWDAVYDAGHAPLFGCMALLVIALIRIVRPVSPAPLGQYLLALLIPTVIGTAIEISQIWSPRDADPVDALNDAIGAAAFLLLFLSVDTRPSASIVSWVARRRWWLRAAALLLLLIPGQTPIRWGVATLLRDQRGAQLCGFDSGWERMFIEQVHIRLSAVPPPQAFGSARGLAGKIVYDTATWTYPTFLLQEPISGWNQFDSLLIDWYLPGERPYRFYLSIQDRWHTNKPTDRFTRSMLLTPGSGTISVAVCEIASAPADRTIDLDHIQSIKLFPDLPDTAFVLYLDNIRLASIAAET